MKEDRVFATTSGKPDAGMGRSGLAAITFTLIGTGLFAVVFALAKAAGQTDMAHPWYQIVFIRYGLGFLVILPLALRLQLRSSDGMVSRQKHVHLARAICGLGSLGGLTYAMFHMPYADAVSISYTKGAIVLILAWWLLKERVTLRHWVAVVTSMVGAVLVAAPDGLSAGVNPVAFAALLSALMMALEMIILKYSAMREGPVVILLYVNGFAAALTALPALVWGQWHSLDLWWFVFLMGPIAIVAQIANIRAFQLADAAFLTPLGYSVVLFSAVIGILVFGEYMAAGSLLGATLIVLGGLVIALNPRRLLSAFRSPRGPLSRN